MTDNKRDELWAPKLNQYLLEAQEKEFSMGEFDCCTFVAGAISAMMVDGKDYMEEFRGTYDSWESAEDNLANLMNILEAKFGAPLPGAYGRKGDIAVFESALGLVLGTRAIFLGEKGLAYVKLSRLDHIFRVPE